MSEPQAIRLELRPLDGGDPSPSLGDWVYIRRNGSVETLYTNAAGVVDECPNKDFSEDPADYTEPFTTSENSVELYYSRGHLPIQPELLEDRSEVFTEHSLDESFDPDVLGHGEGERTWSEEVEWYLAHKAELVLAPPIALVVLPVYTLALDRPEELSLWPLWWERPESEYLTLNLNQGADLWDGGSLTEDDGGDAPERQAPDDDPDAQIRPQEQALHVSGTVGEQVTGVGVRLYDEELNALDLQVEPTADETQTTREAVLGDAESRKQTFETDVYLADADAAFGPVCVVVEAETAGDAVPRVGAFWCQLVGTQIALTDDYETNENGQEAGPVLGEDDEKIIVDFQDSPQETRRRLSRETRARRMVVYDIHYRERTFSENNDTEVVKPEMSMWMAELQIVGLSCDHLQQFLRFQSRRALPLDQGLRLSLEWELQLEWDGPDSGTGSDRRLEYQSTLSAAQGVTLRLDDNDELELEDGQYPGAYDEEPPSISFPVDDRRSPHVVAGGRERSWGRHPDASSHPAVVIEWQPHLIRGNSADQNRGDVVDMPAEADEREDEIIRGGDGRLRLTSLDLQTSNADPGLEPGDDGELAAPPDDAPLAELPVFRVEGGNPEAGDLETLIDAVVEEFYDEHANDDHIEVLSQDCWQETVRHIIRHESINMHHFNHRATGRYRYGGRYYGHEERMPIFGPVHGYGLGQLDNPAVSIDEAWSFEENIHEAARRIMDDKADRAYDMFDNHDIPDPMTDAFRARFQRETVRRYNGGSEFIWGGEEEEWVISLSNYARRDVARGYVNHVFNEADDYDEVEYGENEDGTVTADFGPENYGPGI